MSLILMISVASFVQHCGKNQKNVQNSYLFASTEEREAGRDHVLGQLRDFFGGTMNQSLFFFTSIGKQSVLDQDSMYPHSTLLLICVIE